MLGKGKVKIGRPEVDRDFQRLSKERETVSGHYEEACRQIAKERSRLHALEGVSAFGGDSLDNIKAQARDAVQRINKNEAERDAARAKMRELDDAIRSARIKAAKALAEKHRPPHDANSRVGLVTKLSRHEAEIVAATENKATRDGLQARRALRGVVSLFVCVADEQLGARLRESTELALGAGIIKATDIPQKLRALWGL